MPDTKYHEIPENKNLSVEGLSFSYEGADRDYVLTDIDLVIRQQGNPPWWAKAAAERLRL